MLLRMKVYLDDAEIAVKRGTLAAAMDAGRSEAERKGRVVIEALLDGTPLTDQQLDAPSDEELTAATGGEPEVRFTTADPVMLVRMTLLEVSDVLSGARESHKQAGELFLAGKNEEGLTRLGELLGVWESLRQAVSQGSALLGIDLNTITVEVGSERVPVSGAVEQLGDLLREVKRAIHASDWASLADTVSYDLVEASGVWLSVLQGLASEVDRAADGGASAHKASIEPADSSIR